MNNILLYVEDNDGHCYATLISFVEWLKWRLREQAREPKPLIDEDMHLVNLNAPYILDKNDFLMYEHDIDEEPISSPLVPRKQLAAYSHKPKGVKRCYKTQKR